MPVAAPERRPRLGLALGSGAARGWAHIGVIRALEEAGLEPDVISGTSIGALVGGAYAAGYLDGLEEWVRGLEWTDVVSLLDLKLDGGLIEGRKLFDLFTQRFRDWLIEALPKPFGAVATDLYTGREIWFRDGSLFAATRASIALPGLFIPVVHRERVLVDGGLVNPVPVSLCRAMGADVVIAVDLNTDIVGKHLRPQEEGNLSEILESFLGEEVGRSAFVQTLLDGALRIKGWVNEASPQKPPSMMEVMASSINIMQVRITRSRMAGDPPEAVITPRLADLGLMEFHRAELAIEEGRRAVARKHDELELVRELLGERRAPK